MIRIKSVWFKRRNAVDQFEGQPIFVDVCEGGRWVRATFEFGLQHMRWERTY